MLHSVQSLINQNEIKMIIPTQQGKELIKKEASRIVQVVGTMIRVADIPDCKKHGLSEHYRQGILETVIETLKKYV